MGRILVVEEEPDLLGLWEKFLSRRGYGVIPVSSALECLEKVKAEKPDLDGSSEEILKESRETRDIPGVMLPALTSDASGASGHHRGFSSSSASASSPA